MTCLLPLIKFNKLNKIFIFEDVGPTSTRIIGECQRFNPNNFAIKYSSCAMVAFLCANSTHPTLIFDHLIPIYFTDIVGGKSSLHNS